jgi:hypothetical protein
VRRPVVKRRGAGIAAVLAAALLTGGCATAAGDEDALPLPTFSESSAGTVSSSADAAADQGRLPDDCTRLLTVNDLGALFGLPLDSVAVRTTIGVPAPSVGRTERLACQYTRVGGERGVLLDMNIGAYTDVGAAAKQWQLNADVEDGAKEEVALGGARGMLVQRANESVLMVANGAETVTLVLPERVRIRDLSARDTLVDLVLRVLPVVTPPSATPPAPAPVPTGTTADPAVAAGAAG